MEIKKEIATGGYMACSALLLIMNKNALTYVAAPCALLFFQCTGTAAFALVAYSAESGRWAPPECTRQAISLFLPAAFIFTATVLSSMFALKYNNVDTIMAFRFATPLLIAPCESLFMGRAYPSFRMWTSLLLMLGGTVGFLFGDSSIDSYDGLWLCALWYCVFCVDQLYLKHICVVTDGNYNSTWVYVYYSNLLPLPFLAFFAVLYEKSHMTLRNDVDALVSVSMSVVMSVAMSYFSWKARSLISAASFTLAGNICKLLTLLLNYALWDKHASIQSTGCLLVALAGAGVYKQAPLRQTTEYASIVHPYERCETEISSV